jgi:hypothetical protein
LSKANEKIRKKNIKVKTLKDENMSEVSSLHSMYQAKIRLLDKKLKKLHLVYDDYRDLTESEMILKDGVIGKFTGKVEEYRD